MTNDVTTLLTRLDELGNGIIGNFAKPDGLVDSADSTQGHLYQGLDCYLSVTPTHVSLSLDGILLDPDGEEQQEERVSTIYVPMDKIDNLIQVLQAAKAAGVAAEKADRYFDVHYRLSFDRL